MHKTNKSAERRASASISSCAVSLPVCAVLLDAEFCIRAQIVEGALDAGGMLSFGIATRDAAGWSGGLVKGYGMHRRSVRCCATLNPESSFIANHQHSSLWCDTLVQWGLCSGRTANAPPAAFFECSRVACGAHHPAAGDVVVISGNTAEKWCEVRVERNLHFTRCDDDE